MEGYPQWSVQVYCGGKKHHMWAKRIGALQKVKGGGGSGTSKPTILRKERRTGQRIDGRKEMQSNNKNKKTEKKNCEKVAPIEDGLPPQPCLSGKEKTT